MKSNSGNVYERLSKSSAQILNSRALDIASIALTTLSAIATAYVNAMAHKEVIGISASIGLALLIFCVVEGTLLISNHGLLNVYTNNRQRMWATTAYWIIKLAMWLNIAILCCRLGKYPLPDWLDIWNRWSIAVHAAIGLLLIDLIRNNDSVKQHRMAELRTQTAERDALTARMLNSYGSGLIWASALRGKLDSLGGACRILFSRSEFPVMIRDAVQNLVKEHLQNLFKGNKKNLLQNPVQNLLQNSEKNLRLSATSGQYRTFEGKEKEPEKVLSKTRKSGSGSGSKLRDFPEVEKVRWEPNRKGGIEAWYVPQESSKRSEQTYLGHIGKRTLEMWEEQNLLKPEAEAWICEKKAEKGI